MTLNVLAQDKIWINEIKLNKKNPYIAALITAYVGICRLEFLSIEQQQKY